MAFIYRFDDYGVELDVESLTPFHVYADCVAGLVKVFLIFQLLTRLKSYLMQRHRRKGFARRSMRCLCAYRAAVYPISLSHRRKESAYEQSRIPSVALAIAVLVFTSESLQAAPDIFDTFQPFVSDSFSYDNNLYRLPSSIKDVRQFLGPNTSRDDFINKASAGAKFHKSLGRQEFDLDLRVDDNRFTRNEVLNNTSTQNKAAWNWELGHKWSGLFSAEYGRALAGFSNTGFFGKDMMTTTAYVANGRYEINPRWSVNGGMRWWDTTHSATPRKTQNIEGQTVQSGVTYLSPSGNSIGLGYWHTDATFPNRLFTPVSIIDSQYREDSGKLTLKYAISSKLHFDGEAGYLQRSHPHIVRQDFAGEIWRMGMQWTPTAKTQIVVSGWHELRSFVEQQSSYYVSEGVSVAPTYKLTEKTMLSAMLSWESQDHQANGLTIAGVPLRLDQLFQAQAGVTYSPVRFADLNLGYLHLQRQSNRQFFQYKDDSVVGGITLKY